MHHFCRRKTIKPCRRCVAISANILRVNQVVNFQRRQLLAPRHRLQFRELGRSIVPRRLSNGEFGRHLAIIEFKQRRAGTDSIIHAHVNGLHHARQVRADRNVFRLGLDDASPSYLPGEWRGSWICPRERRQTGPPQLTQPEHQPAEARATLSYPGFCSSLLVANRCVRSKVSRHEDGVRGAEEALSTYRGEVERLRGGRARWRR